MGVYISRICFIDVYPRVMVLAIVRFPFLVFVYGIHGIVKMQHHVKKYMSAFLHSRKYEITDALDYGFMT